MTIIPAYGKDYKSPDAVQSAWDSNQDFQIVGIHRFTGSYINRSDFEVYAKDEEVVVRYANLRKSMIVKTRK